MDSNIRNLTIGILIGLVIVLIIYSFGDDIGNKNNTTLPSPSLKLVTAKPSTVEPKILLQGDLQSSTKHSNSSPLISNQHPSDVYNNLRLDGISNIILSQRELFTSPSDDKIQSLINLVSVGRDNQNDKIGWVNSLSGQSQIITNPRTDIRANIKYSNDNFMKNVEILSGIVGSQFEKILDTPLPTVLYNQTTTTTTTTAATVPTTTTTTTAATVPTTTTTRAQIEPPKTFELNAINNTSELTGIFYIKSGIKYLYYDEQTKSPTNLYFTNKNKTKFELKSTQNNKQLTLKIAGTSNYLSTDPNPVQSEKVIINPSTEESAQLFYYLVNPIDPNKIVLGGKLFNENASIKFIKTCTDSIGLYCYTFFYGQELQYLTLEKVESFNDIPLPKTDEYSKILLKLVNKSKSGVPNPYYFNPRTGFKFYIIFNTNAGVDTGMTITCDAVFTSISDGQEITFDKCNLVYSNTKPNTIQISFIKTSIPDKQLLPSSDYGEIASDLLVTQKFDLQLVTKTTPNFNSTTFLDLINQNAIPAISKLTYTINVSNIKTNESQDILSYEINLAALLARRENMQEYTYKKMGNITEEILNEKVGNIVSPMFLLDSKLNNMENNLKKVQDAYFFNNLSNNQTNYKFFNTTA